jgi:hypothetical protein
VKKYPYIIISTILLFAITLLVSCSNNDNYINNKVLVTKSIKEIEESINKNDLNRFSAQTASTSINKYFKIFAIFASLFDKSDAESNVIIFIPVKYKKEMFGDNVKVDISIEYKGTISAIRISSLNSVLKKIIQIGMPDAVTFEYKKIDNSYKLSNISLGLAYEALISGSKYVF